MTLGSGTERGREGGCAGEQGGEENNPTVQRWNVERPEGVEGGGEGWMGGEEVEWVSSDGHCTR